MISFSQEYFERELTSVSPNLWILLLKYETRHLSFLNSVLLLL